MAAPWANGVRVRVVGEIHGQQCINVLHFATNTAAAGVQEVDILIGQLLSALLGCLVDSLLPATTSDYTLLSLDGRQIRTSFGDPVEQAAPGNSVGELSPTSVSFAAALVQIRTGGGGRSGRGRMFLPPPGEAQITNSTIDGGTVQAIQELLTCMVTKFIGQSATSDWRIGVLSQKTFANTPGNFDNAFREATSLIAVPTVAVMRSRKKGHGA